MPGTKSHLQILNEFLENVENRFKANQAVIETDISGLPILLQSIGEKPKIKIEYTAK